MMNVTEAIHCIGCGAELGLMPIDHEASAHWHCPRCRTVELDAFSSDDGIIHDCRCCGGQFVPHDVLQALVRRYQATDLEPPRRPRPDNPLTEKVTYVPCPACLELMQRRNFGKVSGIVVDVCSIHGTWFDVGEVPRILAFVAKGGLVRGREAEVAERRSLANAHLNATPAHAPSFSLTDDSQDRYGGDVQDAALAFLRWLQSILR